MEIAARRGALHLTANLFAVAFGVAGLAQACRR